LFGNDKDEYFSICFRLTIFLYHSLKHNTHTYKYIHTHTHTQTHTLTHTHTHTNTYTHSHTHTHKYIHTLIHTHTHTHTHTDTHTHTNTYVHTRTNTYTHTHTHNTYTFTHLFVSIAHILEVYRSFFVFPPFIWSFAYLFLTNKWPVKSLPFCWL